MNPLPPASSSDCRALFAEHLPRIEAHARLALRRVRCPDTRADLTAELVALAWRHFAALAARGKRPEEFATTLALRCSQAVRAGRQLAGCDPAGDALSRVAAVRHGVRVAHLGRGGLPGGLMDLLADPRVPVPESVAFRIDFPAWRARIGGRKRLVLDALAGGDRAGEVAAKFGLSPGRVSQLRREFLDDWLAFHGG